MQSIEKNNQLKLIAEGITKSLREKFLTEDGLLFQGSMRGKVSDEVIMDDFGDVAPFIAMYGGEDICKNYLDYIENNIDNLNFDRAFAYTDLILGLIWYSKIGKNKEQSIKLAKLLSDQAENRWIKNKKFYSVSYKNITIPITNGIDSTYIEVWTEMYRLTKERKYADLAIETFNHFRKIHSNNKPGLITTHYVEGVLGFIFKKFFGNKFNIVHVMKDNSNYLFGLLDMYRLNLNNLEVKKSFDAVHEVLSRAANNNELNNFLAREVKSDLLSSFCFIDLSCDAYKIFNESRYLEPAINLANFWLDLPKNKTGLFPRNYDESESYLDSETDMAVALIKLYECTNDVRYHEKAIELLNGIQEFHSHKDGLALKVDVNSGLITNECIKIKFFALHIKLLHIVSESKSIYKDDELFMLAKDR